MESNIITLKVTRTLVNLKGIMLYLKEGTMDINKILTLLKNESSESYNRYSHGKFGEKDNNYYAGVSIGLDKSISIIKEEINNGND